MGSKAEGMGKASRREQGRKGRRKDGRLGDHLALYGKGH